MTEHDPPSATVRKSRLHLSYAWLVPIVAALVGGYLFYQTEIDTGPTINIHFADAPHITQGSKLVYRGVEVGSVHSVELDHNLNHVNVRARLRKEAAGLAVEGSEFWIVEPRLSVGQVSGLDTLLSGSFIQVAPGDGAPTGKFEGLATPPVLSPGEKDLMLVLESDDATSLIVGAPVNYRGIVVGKIASITLPQEGSRVQLMLAIEESHAGLVRTNSIFWRTSGVHFDLQPLDPKISIGSVESLIRGGIAFATVGEPGEAAAPNAVFDLQDKEPDQSVIAPRAGVTVVLSASLLGSIRVGDPVYYREVTVGEVLATGLEDNASAAYIHALIWQRYAPLVQEGTVFWNASGLHFHASLFSGATLELESLASLLAGGVGFATPEQQGTPVKNGSHFVLHNHPKKEWLDWRTKTELIEAPPPSEIEAGYAVDALAPAPYRATSAAHVRAGPDTTYPVISTLDKDAEIEVSGKVSGHDWYRVELGDTVGYVWAKLLEQPAAASAQ